MIKVYFMILPTIFAEMIALDIVFMLINSIVFAFMLFLILTPWRVSIKERYDQFMSNIFKTLFGMSVMDVRGFKCQRTYLQLQLESIP